MGWVYGGKDFWKKKASIRMHIYTTVVTLPKYYHFLSLPEIAGGRKGLQGGLWQLQEQYFISKEFQKLM